MPVPVTTRTVAARPDGVPRIDAMRRAAADFEAVFLGQMLAGLTAGLSVDGPLGGGDDPFAAMLRDEYGKLIGRQGGIGIADAVLRQLLGTREVR
jgi:Rod binding domain-containing protein